MDKNNFKAEQFVSKNGDLYREVFLLNEKITISFRIPGIYLSKLKSSQDDNFVDFNRALDLALEKVKKETSIQKENINLTYIHNIGFNRAEDYYPSNV